MRTEFPTALVEVTDHILAGSRIRDLRIKRGVSLRSLAKKMGFSPPFVSDMERGRRNWTKEKFDLAVSILNKK